MQKTKEKIGIHFEFPQSYTTHLAHLLENVDIEKYTWYVDCSENYYSPGEDKRAEHFLPNGVYTGKEFSSLIRSFEHYIHLIRLLAVPEGVPFDQDTISDHKDYSNRSAEIALLSADSIVDFYAKDPTVLGKVMESCKHYFAKIDSPYYITPENDTRTRFWV